MIGCFWMHPSQVSHFPFNYCHAVCVCLLLFLGQKTLKAQTTMKLNPSINPYGNTEHIQAAHEDYQQQGVSAPADFGELDELKAYKKENSEYFQSGNQGLYLQNVINYSFPHCNSISIYCMFHKRSTR